MSDTRACVRGCTIRGQHAPGNHEPCGCACHNNGAFPPPCNKGGGAGCHETHALAEEDCVGCLPRPVEFDEDWICRACKSRASSSLDDLSGLSDWLRDNVRRGTKRDPDDVNLAKPYSAPLSIEALSDLDDLASTLATWVTTAIEEHPGGLRGPSWHGARIVPASKRHTPHAGIVYDHARVVGLRVGGAGSSLREAAQWIRTHGAWFAQQPWAGDWHDEIVQQVRHVQAKWPTFVRARKAPLPCPTCNRLSLWWHPAQMQGQDALIRCHDDDCARVLTEEDYWVQVMAKRNSLRKKAA